MIYEVILYSMISHGLINYKKEKKAHPDPLQLRHKEKWSAFWKGATVKKQQAIQKKQKLVKEETAKKHKQKGKRLRNG